MRVLIVGGLGYIGSELMRRYKEVDDPNLRVDVIDKRFIPHALEHLPENFRFVQGDIRDENAIAPLLAEKPDVVYLLAAEVQAESSISRERVIWENNYDAIVKVIDKCTKEARLIFASTGNLFGGVRKDEKHVGLTEKDEPRPKFPYAESKHAVELHLAETDKNYVVCRFGTNYGYSPGIRFNLVTNSFTRMALLGETITVHGEGENFRPTLCVKDAVRAMMFLSQRDDVKGEIFHIVSENYKIKDLAQCMKKVNPAVTIEHIAKEVPFGSYNLSSDKIRALGFEFEWTVEKAVREMAGIFAACGRTNS